MYKTISVTDATYQKLQILAEKSGKPKSQIIADLIQKQLENILEEEKTHLKAFNTTIKKLSHRIKLPKGTTMQQSTIVLPAKRQ